MNILLTCAGRRNYLVGYFKQALIDKGLVFTADNSGNAPALQESDGAFIVPTVYDPNYVNRLLSICKTHQVRMIIPLNDLELPILAENKVRFNREGIIVIVSDVNAIDTCFDKWKAYSFASENGIAAPATFISLESVRDALDSGQLKFPLVVKPRWGTASISIEICHDFEELTHAYSLTKNRLPRTLLSRVVANNAERSVIIQSMLHGIEYGLDVVNDFDGRYVCTLAKRKLAMRAGETDKALTVDNSDLSDFGKKIGSCLGHIANLDCDVFETDAGYYLLEMNPRFGGGYPFSHMAGANIPSALLAWADGKTPEPGWLRATPGVISAKCDRLVLITQKYFNSLECDE